MARRWWRTSGDRSATRERPPPGRWVRPRPDLRRAAAGLAEFDRRMSEQPWWTYGRIDREHRSRTLSVPVWFPDWHLIQPDDVGRLAARPGCGALAAELLSMHPDGYVREAAVARLARADSARAFPLLLVRAADWVGPVRERAQAAVRDRLRRSGWAETGSPEALRALALLEQMSAEGTRSSAFASELLDRVRQMLGTAQLLVGLRDDDRRLRRASARVLTDRGVITGDVLAAAIAQDDTVTAHIVATAALLGPGSGSDPAPRRLRTRSSPRSGRRPSDRCVPRRCTAPRPRRRPQPSRCPRAGFSIDRRACDCTHSDGWPSGVWMCASATRPR